MKDKAQTEEAPRIEISSQTANNPKNCFRILPVDDDLCLLKGSKQILTMDNNFEVDVAASVDEAFNKLEKQNYDVIVSTTRCLLKMD